MNFNDDIDNCLRVLHDGGTILYPTDTVWGLGCDATNSRAVEKIFRIKDREEGKSLILLCNSLSMVKMYVREIPDEVSRIIRESLRPVTIIYPAAINLAEGVVAADGSVGIRITSDTFCNELTAKFGKPVVSTSANMSGGKTPALFEEISPVIIDSVDYVVFYRREDTQRHKPSPVIRIDPDGFVTVLRS